MRIIKNIDIGEIMKKFSILIASFFLATSLLADIKIHNKTPWTIRFAASWSPDTSGKSSSWTNPIKPGASAKKEGDLWNQKTRYKVQVYRQGDWIEVINERVSKLGNREVTVFANPEGDFSWSDALF